MKSTPRRFLSSVVAVLAIVAGFFVSAAPAQALEVKERYYNNWFYDEAKCMSQGNRMLQLQPDWIGFKCYRGPGDAKWSMDAYVDDGFGCFAPTTSERSGGQVTEYRVVADSAKEPAPLCG
ncbi:hypothetical protein [Pseudarthrobacter sp. C4D7]|uniref:hypothetical protein n=1 Tax=Pseudarthrobacter sp. C4D7 TaxID=2735268 RepID=UPI0015850534|nr:hypothetical protein [Pseudarthrobacter sp. C4D7]NUT71271.1 hypothetical protein [Pseudarthrobacter sp. C4D7]